MVIVVLCCTSMIAFTFISCSVDIDCLYCNVMYISSSVAMLYLFVFFFFICSSCVSIYLLCVCCSLLLFFMVLSFVVLCFVLVLLSHFSRGCNIHYICFLHCSVCFGVTDLILNNSTKHYLPVTLSSPGTQINIIFLSSPLLQSLLGTV